jgi:hypothetical protein
VEVVAPDYNNNYYNYNYYYYYYYYYYCYYYLLLTTYYLLLTTYLLTYFLTYLKAARAGVGARARVRAGVGVRVAVLGHSVNWDFPPSCQWLILFTSLLQLFQPPSAAPAQRVPHPRCAIDAIPHMGFW